MTISLHKSEQSEAKLVERLLGRPPKLPYRVATRCGDGTPQVLCADPVLFEDNRWKPFPTFLWLVCPRLRIEVARLEAVGVIMEMQERLHTDAEFKNSYLQGQRLLAEWRWAEARAVTHETLPPDVERVMRETSIAGSRSLEGIKCLHAHLAQHLAFGNNPIGELIAVKVGACTADSTCGAWLTSEAQSEGKNQR